MTDGKIGLQKSAEAKASLRERFHALPLDQRRALVRGMVEVVVQPGRGDSRVQVRHLVAESLNAEPVPA